MKMYVDGKMYDLDKATLIHSWTHHFNWLDMNDHSHSGKSQCKLYRTAKGNYLLIDEGDGRAIGDPESIAGWLDHDNLLDYAPDIVEEG